MEHARKPVRKPWHPANLGKTIGKLWGVKKGKAVLLGAAALIVVVVLLLVWLLWPSTPLASGNSGMAVQIGSTIYYANASHQNYLYAMEVDGSNNRLIATEPIGDLATDGKTLYAFINDEYRYVWTVDPQSGQRQILLDTASSEMNYTDRYLYYTDFNKDRHLYSLYLSDPNVNTVLTDLPAYDLSSDGENVYFRYGRDGNYQLCSVPLAGGEVQVILSEIVLDAAYYQGKIYYVDQERNLCSVLPDGSEQTVISQEDFSNIVLFEDQVYFIYNGEIEDEMTGNLCTIGLDGSGLEVLAQGSFSSLSVVEGRIFFLNQDRGLCTYDLKNKTLSQPA